MRKSWETARLTHSGLINMAARGSLHYAVLPLILGLVLIWPFGGGKNVKMMAGTDTPAAQGTINVRHGDNHNTKLDIKVHALAQPSSLHPPANVYVVWVQPPGQNPKNAGEIAVNNNLDGELKAVTPYKRFKVFITAEQNAQAESPQGPQVLSADVAQG